MATPGNGEDAPPLPPPVSAEGAGGSLIAKLREQWRSTKEHAETYPYVWGSYILVYGGLGAYITWRWCKLRRTEDRVRALQARLRQLAAAEESQVASAATPTSSPAGAPAAADRAGQARLRALKTMGVQ